MGWLKSKTSNVDKSMKTEFFHEIRPKKNGHFPWARQGMVISLGVPREDTHFHGHVRGLAYSQA